MKKIEKIPISLVWTVLGVVFLILGAIMCDNVLIGIAVVCFATDTIIQEIQAHRRNITININAETAKEIEKLGEQK